MHKFFYPTGAVMIPVNGQAIDHLLELADRWIQVPDQDVDLERKMLERFKIHIKVPYIDGLHPSTPIDETIRSLERWIAVCALRRRGGRRFASLKVYDADHYGVFGIFKAHLEISTNFWGFESQNQMTIGFPDSRDAWIEDFDRLEKDFHGRAKIIRLESETYGNLMAHQMSDAAANVLMSKYAVPSADGMLEDVNTAMGDIQVLNEILEKITARLVSTYQKNT